MSVELKSERDLEGLRRAGRVNAEVRALLLDDPIIRNEVGQAGVAATTAQAVVLHLVARRGPDADPDRKVARLENTKNRERGAVPPPPPSG